MSAQVQATDSPADAPAGGVAPPRPCRGMAVCLLFAALATALVLLRTGMVVFDMWSPRDGGDLPEALISGNLAFDLLNGAWRGWPSYLYITRGHLGNELLVSAIALPLYRLFGGSLFVLSIVPTLYSLAILFLLFFCCLKWANIRVGLVSSLLFVFCPLAVSSWAIYPYAIHLESSLFSFVAVLCLVHILDSRSERAPLTAALGLGINTGIGVFHSELYLLSLSIVVFFWFLGDRRFYRKKTFLVFVLSSIIALLPYLFFGSDSLIDFFRSVVSGRFSQTYTAGRATHSLATTLELMSVIFWPFGKLSSGLLPDGSITGLGWAAVALGGLFEARKKEKNLFLLFVHLYVLAYISILVLVRSSVQYYCFPCFPHAMVLFGVWFQRGIGLLGRNNTRPVSNAAVHPPRKAGSAERQPPPPLGGETDGGPRDLPFQDIGKPCLPDAETAYPTPRAEPSLARGALLCRTECRRGLTAAAYGVVLLLCASNAYEVIRRFEPRAFGRRLRIQLSRNGCCFYWPWGYFCPDGPKTDVGRTVEAIAARTRFQEISLPPGVLGKTIFVSATRHPVAALGPPASYLIYGKDVSFAGLEALAAQIENELPEDMREFAYQGLAVYYTNDNWLNDLLEDFGQGVIRDHIPEQHRWYFYNELARKLTHVYRDRPERILAAIARFDETERELLMQLRSALPSRTQASATGSPFGPVDSPRPDLPLRGRGASASSR